MANGEALPELRQILGAMIFAANRPLTVAEMRKCITEVARPDNPKTAAFAKVRNDDILGALDELKTEISKSKPGFGLDEVAGGFRIHSDPVCGDWLKHLLDIGTADRLSKPALETLAIIAYRQPLSRADIEAIRGVNVDHVMKTLLEMQLVKIAGRSDLPGRPFLYGTTGFFLEHFGLKSLDDLDMLDPILLSAKDREAVRKNDDEAGATPAPQESGPAPAVPETPEPESAAKGPAENGEDDEDAEEPDEEESEDEKFEDEDEDDEDEDKDEEEEDLTGEDDDDA